MIDGSAGYTTRELSPRTWPAFERFFRRYDGVQDSCWCMYYHRAHPLREADPNERAERNRRDKRKAVYQDRSHAVLVFAGGRVVGSRQFGPKEELPRIDAGRKYRALTLPQPTAPLWRITCFFVDRDHRGRGVAAVALRGAFEAIRRRGGGCVEAYPATNRRAVATWFGSLGMFRREGFRSAAPFGRSNVLVRLELPSPSPTTG